MKNLICLEKNVYKYEWKLKFWTIWSDFGPAVLTFALNLQSSFTFFTWNKTSNICTTHNTKIVNSTNHKWDFQIKSLDVFSWSTWIQTLPFPERIRLSSSFIFLLSHWKPRKVHKKFLFLVTHYCVSKTIAVWCGP